MSLGLPYSKLALIARKLGLISFITTEMFGQCLLPDTLALCVFSSDKHQI